jgi:hypothetical protein
VLCFISCIPLISSHRIASHRAASHTQIGLVPTLWAKLLAESENILFFSNAANVTPKASSLVCYFVALGLACCVGYLAENYFINKMGQKIALGTCCTVQPCTAYKTCAHTASFVLHLLFLSNANILLLRPFFPSPLLPTTP